MTLPESRDAQILHGEIRQTYVSDEPTWNDIWRRGLNELLPLEKRRPLPPLTDDVDRQEFEELSQADAHPPGVPFAKRLFRQFGQGYGEAVVARQLRVEGFHCWTGALLYDRAFRTDRDRAVTTFVEAQLRKSGWKAPVDAPGWLPRFNGSGVVRCKNPDLVVHHPTSDEWRFYEVKREDGLIPGQLEGLFVLHLLTGGLARVVRVGRKTGPVKPRPHEVWVAYNGRLSDVAAVEVRARPQA